MNDAERLQLTKAVEEAIERSPTVASILRALIGNPQEGNIGLLNRMHTVEKRVFWMIWLMPIWIAAGTAGGTLLARSLGLGGG